MSPVYVLVGGRSKRFGADKATHLVDGEPWALHVGRRLSGADGLVTLVGSRAAEGPLAGARRLDDAPECEGPLAGVLAALRDRGEGRLVLAACDLVRPEPGWLTPLHKRLDADAGLKVAAYRADGRWQPFPCAASAAWLATLVKLVADGERSMRGVLDRSRAAAVEWPGPGTGRLAANTPSELEAALRESD